MFDICMNSNEGPHSFTCAFHDLCSYFYSYIYIHILSISDIYIHICIYTYMYICTFAFLCEFTFMLSLDHMYIYIYIYIYYSLRAGPAWAGLSPRHPPNSARIQPQTRAPQAGTVGNCSATGCGDWRWLLLAPSSMFSSSPNLELAMKLTLLCNAGAETLVVLFV